MRQASLTWRPSGNGGKPNHRSTPEGFISEVALEDLDSDDRLVRYELATRRIVVNRNHPFAREHGETHEQQILLRDSAFVDLLTQAYMADLGIHEDMLGQIAEYRDQSLRLVAQLRRRTGVQLAEMLSVATSDEKALETIVTEALDYMGFTVVAHGQPGEPEGVATAPATPQEGDVPVTYSFTYDAKSTGAKKVKTSNLNIAGLVRHRNDHNAEHILVIAPDYQMGALQDECANNGVTPMRASDLGKLLLLVATSGHFDLVEFRDVFERHDPNEVGTWVEAFIESTRKRQRLSLDTVLTALARIGYGGPDTLTASVIAREAREVTGDPEYPTRQAVSYVLYGLSVLVPRLVQVSGDNVYLGADPATLRQEIVKQLQRIPTELQSPAEVALIEQGEAQADSS